MVSKEDHDQLAHATLLLRTVMERHRNEDLRALTLFISALREIQVGERYLAHTPSAGSGSP